MGRYYEGDINGKFWFAVQTSDDGEFFGAEKAEQTHIDYYADDLEQAEDGIKTCLEKLGKYKEKLDKFFKKRDCYSNDEITKEFNITDDKVRYILEWYARLELGIKIRDCIKETGICEFTAEL